MNRAMYAAASGMEVEQQRLDAVSEDLASADVAAFKRHIVDVRELDVDRGGCGVAASGRRMICAQGKLERGSGPCDLAIRGEGYFRVTDGTRIAYTRDGRFARDASGLLGDGTGWHLAGVRVPADARRIDVRPDGTLLVDRGAGMRAAGRIGVARFANPDALQEIAQSRFAASDESGPALAMPLGERAATSIVFGSVERSNVSIVESMMEILKTQRAYEADAKGVQAADDMTRIADNIERE